MRWSSKRILPRLAWPFDRQHHSQIKRTNMKVCGGREQRGGTGLYRSYWNKGTSILLSTLLGLVVMLTPTTHPPPPPPPHTHLGGETVVLSGQKSLVVLECLTPTDKCVSFKIYSFGRLGFPLIIDVLLQSLNLSPSLLLCRYNFMVALAD